ncbi:MAG TPA: magnesium transporter CorA family protein [Gaiellaceae bacterium]|nr:magnesium transporter CorA family protein [Gaiellaceae bacterium]
MAQWIDLIDPTPDELRAKLPERLHKTAMAALLAPPVHNDEPRPRIESHDDYVLGILLIPVAVTHEDRVYYQEIDFVATTETLVTVSKTPPGEKPFDPDPAKEACRPHDEVGWYVYHLVDEVAERYLDLVDDVDSEIDELEDKIATDPVAVVGRRLRELRHDLRGIRRTLTPTRDAVRRIVDDRVELTNGELFPRPIEIAFGDAYDKLLRATEALESSRDSLASERDYLQGKIANDQNEVTKRLTAIASILLVPTFIVGLYGQNFRKIPELHWGFGYEFSWGLIILTTLIQIWFFRRKNWL